MRETDVETAKARLIGWYDRQARALPWRVAPGDRRAGVRPDPYRVWLSEVMLQQTTVAAVRAYYRRFTDRWPTVGDLAAAADAEVMAEWAGLGYYARARNLLACARAIAHSHDGHFPETEDGLRALPGIGPYTAAAIAAIAFDKPAVVVDGNVERVVARVFAVTTPLPAARPALRHLAGRLTPDDRPGDHAQAMMDLGATVCTPRNPLCGLCPLSGLCAAQEQGLSGELPRKTPKPVKPVRQGTVWVLRHPDGRLLVEDRPPSGLLGGMPGFPGNGWDGAGGPPPAEADWQEAGQFRHTFTHFHLDMTVLHAVGAGPPRRGHFRSLRAADLPTLMRKAHDLIPMGKAPR